MLFLSQKGYNYCFYRLKSKIWVLLIWFTILITNFIFTISIKLFWPHRRQRNTIMTQPFGLLTWLGNETKRSPNCYDWRQTTKFVTWFKSVGFFDHFWVFSTKPLQPCVENIVVFGPLQDRAMARNTNTICW